MVTSTRVLRNFPKCERGPKIMTWTLHRTMRVYFSSSRRRLREPVHLLRQPAALWEIGECGPWAQLAPSSECLILGQKRRKLPGPK